jgi:hypothetical protein
MAWFRRERSPSVPEPSAHALRDQALTLLLERAAKAPAPLGELEAALAAMKTRCDYLEAALGAVAGRIAALEQRGPVTDAAVLERLAGAEMNADQALRMVNSLKGQVYREREKRDELSISAPGGVRAW